MVFPSLPSVSVVDTTSRFVGFFRCENFVRLSQLGPAPAPLPHDPGNLDRGRAPSCRNAIDDSGGNLLDRRLVGRGNKTRR